ncbi:MAG: hypothetical protein EOO77_29480 [Oxalobacteraceae bacterium]|nr:MAG: hypothetical protein EOO77_29480 [Oxalobacteraceae bacterium]
MSQTPTHSGFASGQYAYCRDGHKLYVREVLDDARVLASPMMLFEDYNGETDEHPSDLASVKYAKDLYATAPVSVVDGDVVKARADLADLQKQIGEARRDVLNAERDNAAILAKLAATPKFERLFDYLDGKITHFVVNNYYHAAKIMTWAEFAVYQEDKREQGVKLLTLFGDSKGNTEWRMNHYRDGSGISSTCQPCCSFEEALAVAAEWIDAQWVTFNEKRPDMLASAVASADEYGFPVPEPVRTALTADRVATQTRNIEKLETDLIAARERLAAAKEVVTAA